MNQATGFALYEGHVIRLRPVLQSDYPVLHRWRCEPEEVHFLCIDPSTTMYARFAEWLNNIRRHNMMLLILDKATDEPAGYAMTYGRDLWDGWVCITVYMVPEFRMTRHLAEVSLVAADYLFSRFPLRKIYVEVYEFAGRLATYLKRQGYVEEGFIPNHFRYGDGYTGVWTLAYYREEWEKARPGIQRWLPTPPTA